MPAVVEPGGVAAQRAGSARLAAIRARGGAAIGRARHPAVAVVLLVLVVLVGGALRFRAATDDAGRVSADQRAYARLAWSLSRDGTYGDQKLQRQFHWAPGTPALLAAADIVAGRPHAHTIDVRGARIAQAIVGTLTIVAAFALAALVGGRWAGLLAAVCVALYPPAVEGPRTLLSEPLGAFALTVALATLAWAWRAGTLECFTLAGIALGLACLTRADLLAAAVVVPLGVAVLWRARGKPWAGPARGATLLAAAALAIVPWSQYATRNAGHLVPVTDGAAGTLFLGTYLPGDGTIFGAKHALAARVRHRSHKLRHARVFQIPSFAVLDAVAADYPGLDRETALARAVRHNLRVYAARHPLQFAGMETAKAWRMWGRVFRGTAGRVPGWVPWLHRALLLAALAGLVAGLVRARAGILALVLLAVLATTAVDIAFVAEARHALRLMPALIAAGAAGWTLARRPPPASAPARGAAR